MTKSSKGFILIAIIAILGVSALTLGGLFNILDIINGVHVEKVSNEMGGTTYTKQAASDKSVAWPPYHDKKFLPTINHTKAYYWQDKTDRERYILEFHFIYKTQESVDDVLAFYKKEFDHVTLDLEGDYMVIGSQRDGYKITIEIKDDGKRWVSVKAKYPSEESEDLE